MPQYGTCHGLVPMASNISPWRVALGGPTAPVRLNPRGEIPADQTKQPRRAHGVLAGAFRLARQSGAP
jgi:hypothetical protein